jgi:hypothetical protein
MTSSLFALAALLALPFTGGHPADEQRQHHHMGAWSLSVTHDRFAGQVKCKVAAHAMDFERQALVIRLPAKTDTSEAVYRVDGGPARPVRGDQMELADLGFALHQGDLANPSGGLVRVPARLLADAHQVSVQARPGAKVFNFRITGLDAALETARLAGCGPASFQ